MATQISSDIATEVDITARKNDSFYLKVTLTKSDSTAYDFSSYTHSYLVIENSSGEVVRNLQSTTASATLPDVASAISLTSAASGVLTISTGSANMKIPKATYSYNLCIQNAASDPSEKITIMYGKFKINN